MTTPSPSPAPAPAIDPRMVYAALDRLVKEVEAHGGTLADGLPVDCTGLDAKVAVLCQLAEGVAATDAPPIVARLAKLVSVLESLGERLSRTGALETRVGARAVAGAYAQRSS